MAALWICPQITPWTSLARASSDSASSKRPMMLTAFLTFCLAQADSDQ